MYCTRPGDCTAVRHMDINNYHNVSKLPNLQFKSRPSVHRASTRAGKSYDNNIMIMV